MNLFPLIQLFIFLSDLFSAFTTSCCFSGKWSMRCSDDLKFGLGFFDFLDNVAAFELTRSL